MSHQHLLRTAIVLAFVVSCGALAVLQARVTAGECSEVAVTDTGPGTYFPAQGQVAPDQTLAKLFEMTYAETFKVVTSKLAKEQYVLTQCGQQAPSDADVEKVAALGTGYTRKHFKVPVQTSAAMTTVLLGFLDALGVQDRVKYIDQYASAPCWQKALGCGSQLTSIPWGGDTAKEAEQAAQLNSVDVVFMDCPTNNNCEKVNSRANAVHIPVTQDVGPIESAEHIKLVAAFFNMEPKAKEVFEATKKSYKEAATGAGAQSLTVAWISYDSWSTPANFVVSQATYKRTMVTAAGAINFDAATKLTTPTWAVSDAVYGMPAAGKTYKLAVSSTKQEASNTFFAALADVDVVVDEVYAATPATYNFQSFLDAYGLQSDSQLKFVKNKMVLRIDRTLTPTNGLDWFESRIAQPAWAVEGLAHVLHKDNTKKAKYFRNVAENETPDQLLKKENCTNTLPVCSAGTDPETIQLLSSLWSASGAAAQSLPMLATAAALALVALHV
jgi:ABC-type Fe3+-hydroxamate transport system substrate-binding protein